MVKWKT